MDIQQMLQEIYEKIGNYIQHGGAIEGGGWKVYDTISLAGVLSALGHGYWYDFSNKMIMFMKDSFIDGIYWYLLKEDKSDAMLDDQSDETIKAIREIICKCDHVGDGVAYMTNPAQYKCKKCGEMFK